MNFHTDPDQSMKHTLQVLAEKAKYTQDHYDISRKIMLLEAGKALEEELQSIGKPDLVCRIWQVIISALKHVCVKWHPSDVRKCF